MLNTSDISKVSCKMTALRFLIAIHLFMFIARLNLTLDARAVFVKSCWVFLLSYCWANTGYQHSFVKLLLVQHQHSFVKFNIGYQHSFVKLLLVYHWISKQFLLSLAECFC